MSTVSIVCPAMAEAQLQATIDRADEGVGNAKLKFYTTATPSGPGAISGTPMCVITLDKPCGVIASGVLTWQFTDPGIVTTGGKPRTCELVAADGTQMHIGNVTDTDHDGAYRVEGALTEDGEDTPTFYAGGTMTPGVIEIE